MDSRVETTSAQPLLVGEVDEEHARFGLVDEPGSAAHSIDLQECRSHPDIIAAVRTYLRRRGLGSSTRVLLSVAGGVSHQRPRAGWLLPGPVLRKSLDINHVRLMDDLTALAESMPAGSAGNRLRLGGGTAEHGDVVAVLRPGSAMLVSGLIHTDDGWTALRGHGGRVPVIGTTDRERYALGVLRATFGTVAGDAVLSALGLGRLHQAVSKLQGKHCEPLSPLAITERASDGSDPVCVETVRMFCGLLGSFTAATALTLGAKAVLLSGCLLSEMRTTLVEDDFRLRFELGENAELLRQVPVELVTAPTPALLDRAAWWCSRQAS